MWLLIELLQSIAWLGAVLVGTVALVIVRLAIRILTPLLNALVRTNRETRTKGHVFRGEGNDQP